MIDMVERCAGVLFGTAFGDALGAGVEGWEAEEIEAEFGEVREFIDTRLGAGCYTDDTQMTLATARSLVRCGRVDGADCAASCADHFDRNRGYGRSAITVLEALGNGVDYRQTGRMLFPEGSYGNGAAMRIAPVGLLCGTAPLPELRRAVFEAVRATHIHDEAIDGAVVIAAAIATLSRAADLAELDTTLLMLELSGHCRNMEMRARLGLAARLLGEETPRADVVARLGNGVRTLESVPTALYTAFRYIDDPEQALVAAVGCGGDADTIAAMTGALLGALHGAAAFPRRWHEGLERGTDGYEGLEMVARQLAELIG